MVEKNDFDAQINNLTDQQLIGVYTNIPGSIVNRSILSQKFGSQYGGDRNIYDALGYPRTEDLKFDDYYARYLRQDMAKAIIDKPVNATWRGELRIREAGERESETEFEKEVHKLDRDLKLKTWFSRLDKLTGLGHFSVLLLGLDDTVKETDFLNPVSGKNKKLHYVKAISEEDVDIKHWEQNTANPRFGMPTVYEIDVYDPTQNSSHTLQVHHSRVIHVIDGALQSDSYGRPRLEAIFNRLMDLEKITGGDAEMFWRGARPGYAGKEDEGYNLTPDARDAIKAEIKEYEHNLRRFINLKGMTLESLEQQVADPTGHFNVIIECISAVMGIPKRILIGSERGELASTEDRTQWLSEIKTRREEFAESKIIRPFFDRIIKYGIVPAPQTGDYSIAWEDLFAPSKKEKAEVGNTRAEALYYYTRNMISPEIVTPKMFFKYFLGFTDDEAEEALQEMGSEIDFEMQSQNIEPTPGEGNDNTVKKGNQK
jgi:hypothetical protein